MAQLETEGVQGYNHSAMRVAVVGPTGAGKSTLCNMLSQCDEFAVDDGFQSCTTEQKSKAFYAFINGKQCQFIITDTPGFFPAHCTSSAITKIEQFRDVMKKCRDLFKIHGVTVILFVIEFRRLQQPEIEAIKFMKTYFGNDEVSKHIILVFSKCNHQYTHSILNIINNDAESLESQLLLNYLESINQQCVATECVYGDTNKYRQEVLSKIYNVYMVNGICHGTVIMNAFSKLENDIIRLKSEREEKRRQQRMHTKLNAFFYFILVILVTVMRYRYSKLSGQNERLSKELWSMGSQNKALSKKYRYVMENYGPMISEIFSKKMFAADT